MGDGHFINGVKIIGGMVATALFGSFMLLLFPEFLSALGARNVDLSDFILTMFLGIIPTAGGIALIIWGVMGIRANRAREASRNDTPNHRGRARNRMDDQP